MFEWDIQKAIINYEKHGVSFEEATTAFSDPNALDGEDLAHSQHERRRQRLAQSVTGRILLVIYTIRRKDHEKEIIRLISARQASRSERQAYVRLTD
ncbi:MAG: BrnT family toxin [Nitrospira sp.]|nr:BrnT family toxin [Nitrospira sp.]